MKFTYEHNNINVRNLEESLDFYSRALNMSVSHRKVASDESFILVYLQAQGGNHLLELTWLRDFKCTYSLGDNEFHMAFRVDDFEAARKLHEEMNVVVYDNVEMGLYFIADPDGYWIEI
ncbi:MAG: VOC family protein, partial [Bacilli bacterium]